MQVRAFQKAPPFDSLQPRFVSIIGSSNGLLCVAIREIGVDRSPSSLLLWNPATRDVREVPRSRIIDSCEYNCVFGYGFSSFVNDYKIVAIYSADDGEEVDRVIVSFDIVMEAFTLMPLLSGISSLSLTVYKDKPAILDDNGYEDSPNFNLWLVGTVWKNEIVMSGVEIEHEIGNNDEPPKCGICLFNVTTNEFKMLVITKYLHSHVLDYVESLVPVVNIHNIEES
ncbi:hypothetical protein K1719_001680 [Acacia pycnantha]|nr:hypothetical protein K1719_001680 [Acacia pycnantha]